MTMQANLIEQFSKISESLTAEQIEQKRFNRVTTLLIKVSSKIELSESENLELRNDIKVSDLKDRVLLVKKGGTKFKVSYSDNSFTFVTLKNIISAKRIPLQILACKYGSCMAYLESLKFQLDLETTKSQYTKSFNDLVLESTKGAKVETVNLNKQVAKFEVRKNHAILKNLDAKIALKSNVSYGLVSEKTLQALQAKKAKDLAKLESDKAKGILAKNPKVESFVIA